MAAVLDLLVPGSCGSCGLPGPAVCEACQAALTAPTGPGCARCGHPWAEPTRRCSRCPAGLDAVRHAVAYRGAGAAIVRAFKDRARPGLGCAMAAVVAASVPAPAAATLVPVPTARAHLRRRGFNPAEVLADELARRWPGCVVDRSVLFRVRETPPQRGASRTLRRRQARGAFAGSDGVPEGPVVIVDDVLTTGATLTGCAWALRAAGARRVGAVVFARVVD